MEQEYSGIVFYDKNGTIYSQSEKQLIAENIQRILTTRIGERINEPTFGSNVQSFLFMPQLMVEDLMLEIKSSIERCEPRVRVDSCTLTSADQNDIIHIKLELTILKQIENETMTIGVEI